MGAEFFHCTFGRHLSYSPPPLALAHTHVQYTQGSLTWMEDEYTLSAVLLMTPWRWSFDS